MTWLRALPYLWKCYLIRSELCGLIREADKVQGEIIALDVRYNALRVLYDKAEREKRTEGRPDRITLFEQIPAAMRTAEDRREALKKRIGALRRELFLTSIQSPV